ncbi:MAG: phage/plasmid primase, P4 family [Hominisplanchenecus sp.]
MTEHPNPVPEWVDGKKINEVLFCREFLEEHPMVSVGGAFFTVEGPVSDENLLKKQIYDKIKHHITTGLWKKVSNLVEVLRMECCIDVLPLYEDRIHMANGTLFLNGGFLAEKDFCRNRLPVAYNPDAAEPMQWLAFLSQLLYPEDISTLQEFFGYCLIPSTRGQKMLLLTGKGGEGKSRVGIVLQSLLGSNMKTGSISKVENSPFARADLQNMLVMVDDDMKMEALTQTNNIKAIVTAELPMDLEKKGQQSYQGDLRVRFLAFGNGTLQALHDRSFGFFRRQIILEARERDPGRRDDPYLAERLCAEREGIFLWALAGLQRLIRNGFQFTLSNRAKANMEAAVADGNNIVEFMKSQGYFQLKADSEVSSKDFYDVYRQWCEDNALNPLAQKTLCSYLKQNENLYNLEYTNKVHIGGGRYARGFLGIEVLHRPGW